MARRKTLTLALLALAAPLGPAPLEPAAAARFDGLQLVYHATFGNGALHSGVDRLGIGPLQFGDSGEAGINPSWTPSAGGYRVGVTRPEALTGPPVIAGIYATPVNFDTGSVVGLRGTFVAPRGPHGATDVWAVTVVVRPGGVDPLVADPLASATLQIRGGTARLNTPGASSSANLPNVPQPIYEAIFSPTDPQPFTIEMLVDRNIGRGEAILKVGDAVFSRSYQFAVFKADSGPAITNVGVNIAVSNAPGQTASVAIRDFQIFVPRREGASSDPLCPPEFGCRAVGQSRSQ